MVNGDIDFSFVADSAPAHLTVFGRGTSPGTS